MACPFGETVPCSECHLSHPIYVPIAKRDRFRYHSFGYAPPACEFVGWNEKPPMPAPPETNYAVKRCAELQGQIADLTNKLNAHLDRKIVELQTKRPPLFTGGI